MSMQGEKEIVNIPDTTTQRAVAAFQTNDRGSLMLATIAEQKSYATMLMKQGFISATFKTVEQVVIGIQYARALDVDPTLLLRKMYVVNGVPSLFSEGPLGLVQRTKEFESINEYFFDENGERIVLPKKDQTYFGSATELMRRGDSKVQIDYFTIEDVARAGLDKGYNGKKDVWVKYERIMIRYKARTMALRSKFANVLMGIPIAEYDSHFSPDVPEIGSSSKNSAADEINKLLLTNDAVHTEDQDEIPC
ncbi:MAG: hypothetical protein ACHQUC_01330 [Chlamydiales bacterium]